jgi:N-acetylglucosamine malate deacetylase 1
VKLRLPVMASGEGSKTEVQRRSVLAVGAHPDDVEFLCAGTLHLLRDCGFEIHIATMTLGDCGSLQHSPHDISEIRRKEAEAAARLLGASYRYLGFEDFAIFNDDQANRRVTALLRQLDPQVVITHSPQDYLTDHETTSLLIRNACFFAPAPNYDTLRFTAVRRSTSIPTLYYAQPLGSTDIFGKAITPHFYVDVSDRMEFKTEMLGCHESQRSWLRAQHGIDEYVESARHWSGELGAKAAAASARPVRFAEGFRQHLGHAYPQENLLLTPLGARVIAEPEQYR